MEKDFKTTSIIPGISGYVSKPTTYTVNYLNGSQTYTEKFAVINIGAQYTGNASKQIDVIIDEVSVYLGTVAGAATGGFGVALGPLANVALHWIKDQVFNSDGSLTIILAYHNIGTKNMGIDPTFWPGGLDPNFWNGIVNSISVALSMFGSKHDNVSEVTFNSIQKTNGNYSEAKVISAIEMVKKYYAEDKKLENMFSRSQFNFSNEDFLKLGIPNLNHDKKFEIFFNESLLDIKRRSSNDEFNTFMIGCLACKTVAYSTATALVFMGGVVVAELTAGASVVVALASYLGVSTNIALGYIIAAVGAIEFGVTSVVTELCSAAGCC
jgi:hypothetical protein